MGTTVDRLLPSEEAEALLDLAREIATKELAPRVAEAEERAEFPAEAYRLLGRSGLLSLPFAEEDGGGGQSYEVYLQVVEEIATAWPSIGVGISVHAFNRSPLMNCIRVTIGTPADHEALVAALLEIFGAA